MKNSFVIYTDYLNQIEKMNMEQRGVLFTALLMYVSGMDVPDMDDRTDMAFCFIKSQIDKDIGKYEETIKKRSNSGKKGGRPKANAFFEKQTKANKANAFFEKQNNPVYEDVNVYVNDKEKKESIEKKRFAPPTLENVIGYCQEKGYSIDPHRFIDFYESKGWMVGKNKMKDWKAAVRNWARQEKERPANTGKVGFNDFSSQHGYDMDDLEAKLLGGN